MSPFITLTQMPRMEDIYVRASDIVAIVPRPSAEPDGSSIVRTRDGKEYHVSETANVILNHVMHTA